MVDDDDGRRRTPDHGHPISSPCEPNGSGELKMSQKPIKFPSACVIVNKMIIYVNIMTFELQTSIKRP